MRAKAEVANSWRSGNSISTDCARRTLGKPRNTTVIEGSLCDGVVEGPLD